MINDHTYTLANVYAPNDDCPEFFVHLLDEIQQDTADYILIGGDLNKVLNVHLDKRGGNNTETKSAQIINSFLHENDWSDIWRDLHDDTFQFTWRQKSPNIMTRLDYFLALIAMLGMVNKCSILPAVLLDHSPIQLEIIMSKQVKGPGYWKFNTWHLYSSEFVNEVNRIIDYAEFRYTELNPLNKWEMIKHDIREYAVNFSRQVASNKRKDTEKWTRQLTAQYKKLAMINLNAPIVMNLIVSTNERIDKLKALLDKESRYKTQGAIFKV